MSRSLIADVEFFVWLRVFTSSLTGCHAVELFEGEGIIHAFSRIPFL